MHFPVRGAGAVSGREQPLVPLLFDMGYLRIEPCVAMLLSLRCIERSWLEELWPTLNDA